MSRRSEGDTYVRHRPSLSPCLSRRLGDPHPGEAAPSRGAKALPSFQREIARHLAFRVDNIRPRNAIENACKLKANSSIFDELDVRLEDLRAFEAVAADGGFSQAAVRLGMTASAVTRSVMRLEQTTGVRLFHRTTRSVVLSAEGELLMPYARRMLTEAEAAHAALRAGEVVGTLRLTCSATFSRLYLAPIISALAAKYPELRFRLQLTDEQLDLVAGGFDAAIRIGPLQNSQLKLLRIAPERRILCASPAYLELHGVPQHPRDLERHRCMSLGDGGDVWPFKNARAIRVPCQLEANFGDFGLHAAEAGLGIARLSQWLAAPSLRAGRLVRLLKAYEPRSFGFVGVIHTHPSVPAPRVRVFLEEVKNQLIPAPWEDHRHNQV